LEYHRAIVFLHACAPAEQCRHDSADMQSVLQSEVLLDGMAQSAKVGGQPPVSETLVRASSSTMHLACNKGAGLHESNQEVTFHPDMGNFARDPRLWHAAPCSFSVSTSLYLVPSIGRILPPSRRRSNAGQLTWKGVHCVAEIAFGVPDPACSTLEPSYWRTVLYAGLAVPAPTHSYLHSLKGCATITCLPRPS
jgi:hypothetical protein